MRLPSRLFPLGDLAGNLLGGWLGVAAVGSWLAGRHAFGSLGVLTAGVAATVALFAVIASRARR